MRRRLAVLTDVHANLPALTAALAAIAAEGVTALVHTGDAIGIGPYPAETLDRLLHTPGMRLVMGNHDAWFAEGLPDPRPPSMGEGELGHLRWVHAQLEPSLRRVVAGWPWVVEEGRIAFLHDGLAASGDGFAPVVPESGAADLDRLFAGYDASVVGYGHHHPRADTTGRARYVNPGALGCSPTPVARFAILDGDETVGIGVGFRAVPYDPAPLWRAFEEREVPEQAFILEAFFGGPGVVGER